MQATGDSDPSTWRGTPFFMPSHQNQQPQEAALPQWQAPSRAVMEDRWLFRRTMLAETRDHRRIHPHNGMSDTGRNILDVLFDRERRGGQALTLQQKRSGKRGGSPGDRSPATVVESPISTARKTMYEGEGDDAENPVESSESSSSPMAEPETGKMTLRRVTYPLRVHHELRTFAEYSCAVKYHSTFLHHLGGDDELDEEGRRPASSKAVSTISVAFSPDALTMASTHGDHTVKISCCNTGRLLQSLEGHPRTPWTVKYHPFDSERIASGCLGHQVRLWNWVDKVCLQMVRLDFAIISLSFHPSGTLMAVANGTRLHFWGIDDRPEKLKSGNDNDEIRPAPVQRSTMLTEIDQRHMLRCVHFPPNGTTLIIGGVNPSSEDPRRRNRGGIGGGMSFYLRLWDFDLTAALQPSGEHLGIGAIRRGISNPQTFVPRALLYNDGGFDVSPDGKTLCACAEYWLPEGVDNAMELLHREERLYQDESTDQAAQESPSASNPARSLAETHSAVSAALAKLKGITKEAKHASLPRGRSPVPSFPSQNPPVPGTPTAPSAERSGPSLDFVPRTPPIPREQPARLSPPSPPGRRYAGGLGDGRGTRSGGESSATESQGSRGLSTPPPPPPPPPPPAPGGITGRPPHPLSVISSMANYPEVAYRSGRYVPHVVTVSLDTTPIPRELEVKLPRSKPLGAVAKGYRPRLGQLLEACPLDAAKASAVTCVKFSPSTDFCLIGYGVREPMVEGSGNFHPVTALYRIRGGMNHVSTMLSGDDDVNIARFHPDSGHGFVYGTKQGRVRVLSPRPWNFYNC